MNFLRVSTPEEKTALLNFASDQYRVYAIAYVSFQGVLGNGKCNCVSNLPSGKPDIFSFYQCDCGAGLYSICEFKYPRGEKLKMVVEIFKLFIHKLFFNFLKFLRFAT